MHTLHGQLTYGLSFGSSFKPVVVLSVLSGSDSSGFVKRAVLPGTILLAWPSKLKTQRLESVSTWISSPLALTTMPHNAWQTTSACLRISILTKLNNKLRGGSMIDW
jgi:hypothetical protein